MAGLMVNVDHVATVRQARGGSEPDPVVAAALAELAGCDGIIVHLREDRRHIQDRDLELLRKTVKTKLNLEMAAVPEMVEIAQKIKPDIATLVPEKRRELTTEGGLDVRANRKLVKKTVKELQKAGITVSLFVDPNQKQIEASKEEIEADYIELHTGAFSEAKNLEQEKSELQKLIEAVEIASRLGLGINAGHGLDYQNIKKVISIEEIEEFSIGHSIVARAVMVGMEQAVREMLALIKG
ncbi:MAG: pyridoxine 5'-phosphate synthase [Deltaproteobacteria bacterium DG_8]|nr:MAG: pyridoxine 5'-phosphate synthase [Deltaproteobacteria bacterium DG_8]